MKIAAKGIKKLDLSHLDQNLGVVKNLNDLADAAEYLGMLGGVFSDIGFAVSTYVVGHLTYRIERRDRLILRWRDHYGDRHSERADAQALRKSLLKYVQTWRRTDQQFAECRPSDKGMERESWFLIMQASAGFVPSVRVIRRIFAEDRVGQSASLTLANGKADSDLHRTSKRPVLDHQVISLLTKTPQYAAAVTSERKREVTERQAHIDAIAQLDAEAERAYHRHEKLRVEALKRENQALAAFKIAAGEYQKILGVIASERFAHEMARREHESALLAPDYPEIQKFRDEALNEIDVTLKSLQTSESIVKNQRTGKSQTIVESNSEVITTRVKAIRLSLSVAQDLRMMADLTNIPSRLAALRESWRPKFMSTTAVA